MRMTRLNSIAKGSRVTALLKKPALNPMLISNPDTPTSGIEGDEDLTDEQEQSYLKVLYQLQDSPSLS